MNEYEQTLARLLPRITGRDKRILYGLWEHRVLTTHHLHQIFFPDAGARRARSRMLSLHRYGVVNRFRRHAHDRNAPDHWILSPTGAVLVALDQGKEPDALSFRGDRALAVAFSAKLDHILGLAQARVEFLRGARQVGAKVGKWKGERTCERDYSNYCRPDGLLSWYQSGKKLWAFVEYDTGSESLSQLQTKMYGYARLAETSRLPSVVLFLVHSEEREANAAKKLAQHCSKQVGVYLSTHHRMASLGAGRRVWRSATDPRPLSLLDIALLHPWRKAKEED